MPQLKTFCASEYDPLKRVILCEPQYMTIRQVINDTQKKFKDEGIHIEKALKQHKQFVQILLDHGIDVILLPPRRKFPEQVFTRDIGFTLGPIIYVADMAHDVRKGEEQMLKHWLEDQEISYFNLVGNHIEGGDVIIDRDTIYIGISNRTDKETIQYLQNIVRDFEVVPVPFTEKYLHLDCVFNIISPKEALFFPGAFTQKEINFLTARYDLIEVNGDEQFQLGTNVLSIGNKKILSLPVNTEVNRELRKRGYEIIEVDITEIIKSGGSFRCCTMPLVRAEA
ncbi:N-dimethylarginine dimethylaminohydrolase [Bacillus oleivorans]|uniref:N-dimethylarginine dimethylaminohydrolase n=1 Tax=Bacillus oleivorans TaxID=1448271 RepID=A0A285CLW2_9BACI|nr:dimethylarginine dimethylaminohydrolase family protein [Bacillus oleivorans]SNX68531.1 N-dimethylarginine dimethylaminohydrolase [Bacillus oleivorans]